jgi:hypothetical protein
VEPPVEERALAEAGPRPDAELGWRLGPTRARDQDPLAGLAVDQEEREEIVPEGLVVEARDDGSADLGFRFRGRDRRSKPQEGGLPQGEIALMRDRAGDRRGRQ